MVALFCLVRKCMAEIARVVAGMYPELEPEYAVDTFSGGLHAAFLAGNPLGDRIRLKIEFGTIHSLFIF